MIIKIQHQNPEVLNQVFTGVINIACITAMGGNIPSQLEMETPQQRGKFWYREKKNGIDGIDLYPAGNDYWARVLEEGEGFILVRFNYRYDRPEKQYCDALCALLAVRFEEVTIIKET